LFHTNSQTLNPSFSSHEFGPTITTNYASMDSLQIQVMGGNDQVRECHNLNLLGFATKLEAQERMWIGKCFKTLSHSHKWNGAKGRWIPNTYKWESLWKVESQDVLNSWDKIANNKPYANGDFFINTRNLPIYVTTLFMTT
jgi:hypothetical protein